MAIVLFTPPYQQFDDDNGNPLSGGKVYSYTAGTLTPRATYTDQSGLTPNANPVILDSAGRADIWLDNSVAYKFIVKTSADVTVRTVDNITPFNTASGLSVLGNIPANTIVGNNTGASAAPIALTVSQAQTLLLFSGSPISNSLTADVVMNNTAVYFDGPTIAQGTSGTWDDKGTVTLRTTTASSVFNVKLHDGTTTYASAVVTGVTALTHYTVSLSFPIASPTGNIRISVRDVINTDSRMMFNSSGNSKDCTISAIRIA